MQRHVMALVRCRGDWRREPTHSKKALHKTRVPVFGQSLVATTALYLARCERERISALPQVPDKEEVLLVNGLEFFGVPDLLDTSLGEEVQKPVIIRFRRSLQAARGDGGGTGWRAGSAWNCRGQHRVAAPRETLKYGLDLGDRGVKDYFFFRTALLKRNFLSGRQVACLHPQGGPETVQTPGSHCTGSNNARWARARTPQLPELARQARGGQRPTTADPT